MNARALALLLLCSPAAASDPAPSALVSATRCRAEVDSGRLLCRVSLEAPEGRRIAWADVVVREAPAGVQPLRSRVAAEVDASGARARGVLGLVAEVRARGVLVIESRAVLCHKGRDESCRAARVTERVDLGGAPPAH